MSYEQDLRDIAQSLREVSEPGRLEAATVSLTDIASCLKQVVETLESIDRHLVEVVDRAS